MMAPVLALLATLGFVAAVLNLYRVKPENYRQAQKLVIFFGYSALLFLGFLAAPVLTPVGGGV